MPKRRRRRRGEPDRYWFDEAAADHACTFFERFLLHSKGEWAGQPFRLEPWQRDRVIRPLFGWKRADGTRRYRTAFVSMGRKCGKSEIGAGIALYCLIADGEIGAEVYSAAADRDQAAIVFEAARSMVEASPALARHCEVYRRAIVVPSTGSSYKVLSADAPTKHGKNAHAVIFDELHAQPNRDLWDVLKTAMGARRQPLMVALTTAGFDRESICREVYDYACKVRDGIIVDDTFLTVIYETDKAEDWTDPKVWAKANPNLGVCLKIEFLQEECRRAQESPAYQNTFRRLHLNQWTEQETRWIDMRVWDRGGKAIDLESLEGRPCTAGLDLSSRTDLSAFVLLFAPDPNRGETHYQVLPFFWMPAENIRDRARRDRVPLDLWVGSGHIAATEGNVIDYRAIQRKVCELRETYDIREIAIDRWNSTQLAIELEGEGLTVCEFGQGYKEMSDPTKELDALIISERLQHGGHPVLRWMASNVALRKDPADNWKPDKGRSQDRIDGIVALVMALGRMMVQDPPSIYEKRGMISIW